MNCKLKKPDGEECGVLIDYNPDTKTATNASDGSDHSALHPKKKNFTSGKAKPIEAELELLAKFSNLQGAFEELKIQVQRHEAEIKTLFEQVNE